MIFAVYKPKGISSNGVLNKLRAAAGTKKIGHAGTLDPLAEGVLVVGVGKESTKRLMKEVMKEKEYRAVVRLGVTSSTDDEEGIKIAQENAVHPSGEEIRKILPQFIGHINQVPPIYSALKVNGKEAYKRARAGEHIVLPARWVEVRDVVLESYTWPDVTIHVTTGPGVYIRSLARDIGKKLGTGGYMAGLVRTRVGEWNVENTYPLDEAVKKMVEFLP